MSSNNEDYIELTTLNVSKMNEGERKVHDRQLRVFENMCVPIEDDRLTDEALAEELHVSTKTIQRDRIENLTNRPRIWAHFLAESGFLYRTMEYEQRLLKDLEWLNEQRNNEELDPIIRLAYQKEIRETWNTLINIGSKHAFYEGIKKIVEENEAKTK